MTFSQSMMCYTGLWIFHVLKSIFYLVTACKIWIQHDKCTVTFGKYWWRIRLWWYLDYTKHCCPIKDIGHNGNGLGEVSKISAKQDDFLMGRPHLKSHNRKFAKWCNLFCHEGNIWHKITEGRGYFLSINWLATNGTILGSLHKILSCDEEFHCQHTLRF